MTAIRAILTDIEGTTSSISFVHDVLCEQGDLIGVPDGTRHWFDMSESPYFVAIRLFTNKEGWVAQFTGEDIALQFPRMTPHASTAAA